MVFRRAKISQGLKFGLISIAICFLVLSLSNADVMAGDEGGSGENFYEILRNAKPAPVTPGVKYDDMDTNSTEQRAIVTYDLETKAEEILAPPEQLNEHLVPRIEGREGIYPSSEENDQGNLTDPETEFYMDPETELFGEQTSDADNFDPTANSIDRSCDVRSYPYNTILKMLMRFTTSSGTYYYVCSAEMVNEFHALTAGHCIYNHDPNDDGNQSDARWADEIWVWPAQSNLQLPSDMPDWPYGGAKAVYIYSYTGWTQSENYDHDWGVITLDRRAGSHTGWMGLSSGTSSLLNYSGYPVETPYVPSGELCQYYGYTDVLTYYTYRIYMNAYVYGGHSGGPAWRYDSSTGDRYIQGMNSTSNRAGAAYETRVVSAKISDLLAQISGDESVRPPTARPDLVEYLFTLPSKDLLDNSVAQNGYFDVNYKILNSGFASSGTITVKFYLSTNTTISSGDYLVGTRTLSSLSPWTYWNASSTNLQASVPPGTYYVGYIMSCSTSEYNNNYYCNGEPCDNVVVIADETLTVVPTYTLTVTKSGTGSGAVTSSPAGINCGSDCSESYTSGTTVTLSASAASGSTFAGWSGACSGTGTCTVSMTANRSVTATFNTTRPIADIKANGEDGPISVSGTTMITVEISLDKGDFEGHNADWWVVAQREQAWYHFDTTGEWKPGLYVSYQGPIRDLSRYQVLKATLPIGNYIFYFGVDAQMNGNLDLGALYHDNVEVEVK